MVNFDGKVVNFSGGVAGGGAKLGQGSLPVDGNFCRGSRRWFPSRACSRKKGRHGIGLADKAPFTKANPWSRDLVFWLKEQKFVK